MFYDTAAVILNEFASCGTDSKLTFNKEGLEALRLGAKALEDLHKQARQATVPPSDADQWRDHCRELLRFYQDEKMIEAGLRGNDALAAKLNAAQSIAANVLLPKEVRDEACKFIMGQFNPAYSVTKL